MSAALNFGPVLLEFFLEPLKYPVYNCTIGNPHRRTTVRNRNLLFIIDYMSYFLTDFEFGF